MGQYLVKKYRGVALLLVGCFIFCFSNNNYSQNRKEKLLSDISFKIGDFGDGEIALSYLNKTNLPPYAGLSIWLDYDSLSGKIFIPSKNSNVFLLDFLETLNIYLSENKNVLFPLFVDGEVYPDKLIQAFEKANLLSKAFHLPIGERLPYIKEFQGKGKNLLLFSFNSKIQHSSFNNAWEHMAEFPFTIYSNPIFEGNYTNGSIQKGLLLVRHFSDSNINSHDLPNNWADLNTNQFCLDHLLKCWQLSGKRPNFVFYTNPRYEGTFHRLLDLINTYPNVSGSISYLGKPLETIYWQEDAKFTTHGNFNFPITIGESLKLTPFGSGYEFSPKSVMLSADLLKKKSLEFKAKPLPIDKGMTGYYAFNNDFSNAYHISSNYSNHSCEFTTDIERGEVLKFPDSAYVVLEKAADYGLVNSSFTIGLFFKLTEISEEPDYSILGTDENEYRKGLHLNIRNKVPYFGFFSNDLIAPEEVKPMQWYQIVIRYNLQKHEQSIFINGLKVRSSRNHPSFLGESELILGRSIKQDYFFKGYMDDLCIWNRALGDDEVKRVFVSGITNEQQVGFSAYLLWLISVLMLVAFLIFLWWMIKKQRKIARLRKVNVRNIDQDETTRNTINTFGDFRVFDKQGEDITTQFSPKIKELFLLILFHTFKSKKGISSQKITDIIWKGFSSEKAANNRGVTFNKLRKVLSKIEGADIVYEKNRWKTLLQSPLYCDYSIVRNILYHNDAVDEELYLELYSIVKRGRLTDAVNWEWLDDFRPALTFDIIDKLIDYAYILHKNKSSELLSQISTYILQLDDLNEQALYFQINCLKNKGNSKKARYLFDKFIQNYFACYNQNYPLTFQEFVKKDVTNLGFLG